MFELIKALGPTAITVVFTAIFAAYFVPKWQEKNNNRKFVTERRMELIEDVSAEFSRYIISWRRLIQLARAVGNDPDADEADIIANLARERSKHRDELFAALHRSGGYFDSEFNRIMSNYMDWDEDQSIKSTEELPDISEWWLWQDRVVSHMKSNLRSTPGLDIVY